MKEDRKTTETKEVLVCGLPESYYKERLYELVQDPDQATVFVAAIQGGAGDWGAYIGWPGPYMLKPELQKNRDYLWYALNVHAAEDVIERGDKMGEEMAVVLFPNWAKWRYRA